MHWAIKRCTAQGRRWISERAFPATRLNIARNPAVTVHRNASAVLIGSCFSSNVGEALRRRKFNVNLNPQGIQFNPVSISETLQNCIYRRQWTAQDLCCASYASSQDIPRSADDLMFSYHHHSNYSALRESADDLLARMNAATAATGAALRESNAVVFLTLGTSKIYNRVATGEVVSNCHRQPHRNYTSRLLQASETVTVLEQACLQALAVNNSLRIVFTVSPVRHTRDGIVENCRSKAALSCAVSELVSRHPSAMSYFPAYEIMMDELRDYRWYDEDMVHPSTAAVSYIYSLFEQAYMDEDTVRLSGDILKIQRSIEHRAMSPRSSAHQRHLQGVLRSVEALSRRTPLALAPDIRALFQEEVAAIHRQLGQAAGK